MSLLVSCPPPLLVCHLENKTSALASTSATVFPVSRALPLLDNKAKHRQVPRPLLFTMCRSFSRPPSLYSVSARASLVVRWPLSPLCRLVPRPPPLLACKREHRKLFRLLFRPVCRSVPQPSLMLPYCLAHRPVDGLLLRQVCRLVSRPALLVTCQPENLLVLRQSSFGGHFSHFVA